MSQERKDDNAISRRAVLKGAAAGAALTTGFTLAARGAPAYAQGKSAGKGAAGGSGAPGEDLRLVNGKFVDGRGVVASAISIKDGRIAAVGQPSGGGPGRTINLKGRTVIPGLIDSHVHFSRTGTNPGWETRWVETAFSIAELQEVIAERAETVPPGEFITCQGGWTPLQFTEQRHATREELDEAAPDHAVYLQAGGGAGGVTNSLGAPFFEAQGISVADNGQISNTGAAAAALRDAKSFEDKVRGTADIIAFAAEVGLTGIHDVGNVTIQPDDYAVMNALYIRNGRQLDTRMRHYNRFNPVLTPTELETYMHPLFREAGDDTWRINGVGEQITSAEDFEEGLRRVARRQWRVQQHFGPANIVADQVAAFHAIGTEFDITDLRWSYGHAGVMTDQQIADLVSVGIGFTITRGPARTFLDTPGLHTGGATDATNVSWLNPWVQIYFFVTRRNQQGNLVLDGEQISRLEALELYTKGSAWFSYEDHELGSFEVGKLADLVVLNQDYLTVPDQQLLRTRSLLTLLGGSVAHAAGEFADLAADADQPFPDRFPEGV